LFKNKILRSFIGIPHRKTLDLVEAIGGGGSTRDGHPIAVDSSGNIHVAHIYRGLRELPCAGMGYGACECNAVRARLSHQ
jgi:hypothetical protein